jgi:hypothetical protein
MTRQPVSRHRRQVVMACRGHATNPFCRAPPNSRLMARNERCPSRAILSNAATAPKTPSRRRDSLAAAPLQGVNPK